MAGRFSIKWSSDVVEGRVSGLPAKTASFVAATLEYHAAIGESYMKKNARWQDRTGNARNSLHTKVFVGDREQRIVFAHGMSYGIWLEVRHAGRYSIIRPTVQKTGPEIMGTIRKGLARL